MKKQRYESDLTLTQRDRAGWRRFGVIMALANVMLVMGILSVMGTERTIVVPAVTKRTFWLEDETASPEYLEQMAVFFSGLMLNVSASNAEYQGDLFLQYTHPRVHGLLKTQLEVGAQRMKRENASQTFYPMEIETDAKHMRVVVHGEETLIVGQKVIKRMAKSYRTSFKFEQGRVYVTEFKEVDKNDPFKDERHASAGGSATRVN